MQQVVSLHGSLTGGARSALLQALAACPALDFHQAVEEALSLTTGDELLDVNHWRDFVWLVMPAWLAAAVSTLGARDMAAMAATAAMHVHVSRQTDSSRNL